MILRLNLLLRKKNLPGLLRGIADSARRQNQSFAQALRSFVIFGAGIPHFREKAARQGRALSNSVFHPEWIALQADEARNGIQLEDYDSISQLSAAALTQYSLPHQLHAEDRHSMMHSIESRLPFLDHRLVEFTTGLPDRYIIRGGSTKAVLRSALKDILPPGIYHRHSKLGFPGPEEPLFAHHNDDVRKAFQHYINELPSIFSPALLQLFSHYKRREIPYDNLFFRVLSFGAWASEFGIIEPKTKNARVKFSTVL